MIKNEKSVVWVLLGLFIMIGCLIYILMGYIFNVPVPNSAKKADVQTFGQGKNYANTAEGLKERTDILGSVAYNNYGEVLGTLYDVYVLPQTGVIEWMSLNIEGGDRTSLVILPKNMLTSLSQNSPVIINISKDVLMDYPVQQRHEEDLAGLISLRELPDSLIVDSTDSGQIGTVSNITYKDGAIDKVYFEVTTPLAQYPNEQSFMIPFQYLNFINVDNPYNQGVKITLTERQAGAIDAYATIRGSQ